MVFFQLLIIIFIYISVIHTLHDVVDLVYDLVFNLIERRRQYAKNKKLQD